MLFTTKTSGKIRNNDEDYGWYDTALIILANQAKKVYF